MMGGSRMRKNMVGEKLSTLLMLSLGRRRMKTPVRVTEYLQIDKEKDEIVVENAFE